MRKLTILSYKRRRKGKTNYHKRLSLLKSEKIRLVIRKSLNNILLQLVQYNPNGDKIIISLHSAILKKYGWNFHRGNIPAAYLIGLICGKTALKKNIKDAILDLGLNKSSKGSVQYAAVKGILDSGLNVPCDEEVFPKEDQINGKNISEEINKKFDEVKDKIIKE